MPNQEKPWWDCEEWLGSLLGDDNVPYAIPGLVAEAERRGSVAAWLEAIKTVENDRCLQHMCRETWDECECQTQAVVMGILTRMYEKAKVVLKKPVTDGGEAICHQSVGPA